MTGRTTEVETSDSSTDKLTAVGPPATPHTVILESLGAAVNVGHRTTPVLTYEEHLFKGLALTWGHPAEAVNELETAYHDNSASLLVRLVRCNAICWNAMDKASLDDARAGDKEAAILRTLMPDTPLPISVHLLSTIIEANLLRESGRDNEGEELLKSVDVDDIDPHLLDQVEVRWARCQYFLRTGQSDRFRKEIERVPLDKSGVYLALTAAVELYRQGLLSDAMELYRTVQSWDERVSMSSLRRTSEWTKMNLRTSLQITELACQAAKPAYICVLIGQFSDC